MMADNDAVSAEPSAEQNAAAVSAGFAEAMDDKPPQIQPATDDGAKPGEKTQQQPTAGQDGDGAKPPAQGEDKGAGAVAGEPKPGEEPSALDRLHKSAEPPKSGEQQPETEAQAETSKVEMWNVIEAKHPNGRQIVQSQEFANWLARQDESTQFLANQGGAHGGIMVLNHFLQDQKGQAGQQGGQGTQGAVDAKQAADAIYNDFLGQKFKDADGGEKSIKDFVEEVGDYGNALAAVFRRVADIIAANKGPDVEALKRDIAAGIKPPASDEQMRQQVAETKFWVDVSAAHPDGRRIWASKEFQDFWKEQPDHVRRKYAQVANSDDAIIILDAYKEYAAKAEHGRKAGAAADRFSKVKDLHKGSVKPGGVASDGRTGSAKAQDYGAGFSSVAEG